MQQQVKLLRVFIASPRDLAEERRALHEVVASINEIFSKETAWRIELLGWEDTLPGNGRPQDLINADLDKADLFIGCLWQRWGTPSGSGEKTGFEEEFDRAMERRKRTESPEIWLFFKDVDPNTQSDPGDQLKKVLAFRAREISERRLLFRDFNDTTTWKKVVSELLQRRMLRSALAGDSSEKDVQGVGTSPGGESNSSKTELAPRAPAKGSVALTTLADLLTDAGRRVRKGELAAFDRTGALEPRETARILLFSAMNYDWNVQHIEFGAHEINSIYLHRTTQPITNQERLFIVRTLLLDGLDSKPGWYWNKKFPVKLDRLLPWFACNDSEASMRIRAVNLATEIGLELFKKRAKQIPPIVRLLNSEVAGVRMVALQHLGALGRPRYLSLIRPLLVDEDKDVRTQAERAIRLIQLRADPEESVKSSIVRGDPFDDELSTIVSELRNKLSGQTLVDALSHASGALRVVAAKELLARGGVSAELAARMCADKAAVVRECGFLALVAHRSRLDPSAIRKALSRPILGFLDAGPAWDMVDAEVTIEAYFGTLEASELWQYVESFDEQSPFAVRALASMPNDDNRARIRAEYDDGFSRLAAVASERKPHQSEWWSTLSLLGGPPSAEPVRKKALLAALQGLADHPESIDRERFLSALGVSFSDPTQVIAALRGLAQVGKADDREKLAPHLAYGNVYVESEAARTYLLLSGNFVVAAKSLLESPNPQRTWVVISQALKHRDAAIWPVLEPLLAHENERIRRMACYYATCTMPNPRLKKLLSVYLRRDRYFYNVVTLLDRALYAPKQLKALYSRQEDATFKKWQPATTWE